MFLSVCVSVCAYLSSPFFNPEMEVHNAVLSLTCACSVFSSRLGTQRTHAEIDDDSFALVVLEDLSRPMAVIVCFVDAQTGDAKREGNDESETELWEIGGLRIRMQVIMGIHENTNNSRSQRRETRNENNVCSSACESVCQGV